MATPQNPTQEAQQLGFPATLFGFTPNDRAYWHEPGLPWFTPELRENPPLNRVGLQSIPCIGDIATDSMAPRFPRGCAVNTMPVHKREYLVLGRVYTHCFLNAETGEWEWAIGRLVKIGGNYLEVKADNDPTPAIWLLREEEAQAVWDVWEVTHYAYYPDLSL
ncbi:MAG: hypothetical protein ACRYFX_09990 [Janthinobacterium lividum]